MSNYIMPLSLKASWVKDFWTNQDAPELDGVVECSFKPDCNRSYANYRISEFGGIAIFSVCYLQEAAMDLLYLEMCIEDRPIVAANLRVLMGSVSGVEYSPVLIRLANTIIIRPCSKVSLRIKPINGFDSMWVSAYNSAKNSKLMRDDTLVSRESWRSEVHMFLEGQEIIHVEEND